MKPAPILNQSLYKCDSILFLVVTHFSIQYKYSIAYLHNAWLDKSSLMRKTRADTLLEGERVTNGLRDSRSTTYKLSL